MNKFIIGFTKENKKIAIITHKWQDFGMDNFKDKLRLKSIESFGVLDVNKSGLIHICKSSAIYNPNAGVFIEALFYKGLMMRTEMYRRYAENDIILTNYIDCEYFKNPLSEKNIFNLSSENANQYFYNFQ